ncbi:MAG: YjiH family protein [Bernardetiaceae bacterium]|nr:YjiH family protein [Bernardetiaceae bacterium]
MPIDKADPPDQASKIHPGITALDKRLLFKLTVPSLIGVFAFLFPVVHEGQYTIVMAILANMLQEALSEYIASIVIGILFVSATATAYFTLIKPSSPPRTHFIRELFSVSIPWLLLRWAGLGIGLMIHFSWGPEWIWSERTGQIVLHDLATAIITIFLFAALLLPLLTEFGLMEFIGTLFRNLFRKLFCIPGRASIDTLASWLSSAPVGVLITAQQYVSGYYSARHSAVIVTNFSIVSLPFTLVVAEFAGLGHMFLQYYATVVVAGVLTAIILPRIPPLSRIADDYYPAGGNILNEEVPAGRSLVSWGAEQAINKARTAPNLAGVMTSAVRNVSDIWFGLTPPLIAIATLGLVVAEFTPILTWLSLPLVPILELMQLPEADKAAPAFLLGFAEMFLPAVAAASIESELTRFVIIAVSITQLIYMSEVGVLILKSKIPLNFLNLVTIFLLRTAISLPIVVLIAHFVVF